MGDRGDLQGGDGLSRELLREAQELHAALEAAVARSRRVSAGLARALEQNRAELRRAQREAAVAERIKREFLTNMTHELRTPLTAILGFGKLLLDGDPLPPDAQRENLEAIQRNAENLLHLLGEIFDLSQLGAGAVELERDVLDPVRLVRGIEREIRPVAAAKGLGLDVTFAGAVPAQICSDATRLRQVLIQLLRNALEFTDVGGVRLMVRLVTPEGAPPRLRFDVIDTGSGLAPEALERVFSAFTQGDGSHARRVGGAGLGLTVAVEMAQVLGGELRAESIEGHGSVFQLSIPTGPLDGVPLQSGAVEDDPTHDDTEDPSTRLILARASELETRARVLYVEDAADNRRLIAFVLRKAQLEVVCAENGEEGVRAALDAVAEERPFEVILMDLQMPVLDGYEATRRLRGAGYAGPIIALTAHPLDGERQRALEAGCDQFLTKPIDRRELLRTVLTRIHGDRFNKRGT